MNLLTIVILVVFLTPVKGLTGDESDCSEWAKEGMGCRIVTCAAEISDVLGVWDGVIELIESPQKSTHKEVRVIYSKKSCYLTSDNKEHFIVGRQTNYFPKKKPETSRTENSLLIYGENKVANTKFLRFINPGGDREEYTLELGDPNKKTWVRSEDTKRYELHETRTPGTTKWEVELRVMPKKLAGNVENTNSIVLMRGYKKSLAIGETSYFAGQAWVFNGDGTLERTDRTIVEKTHDPSEGKVYQRELRFPAGHTGGEPSEVFTAYDVVEDSPGLSRSGQKTRAVVEGGYRVEKSEMTTKEGIYSEQRHYSRTGNVTKSEIRAGRNILKEEFDRQYQKVHRSKPQVRPGM